MGKDNSPQTVNIDGTEYQIDDLSDRAKRLIDHVADLDRKAASMDFQREQIQLGRDTAFKLLKEALESAPETVN